ncbi:MAG: substrate-binding domain-containing protein [Chloroflexi bacterium]|nr:substrate-binding domain-containing protein [Chloroflexota bacterium]
MGRIGVVISGVIIHDYLGEVFRGVADTAKQNGYSLITSIQNPRRHDNLAHLFAPGICDGIVVVLPYNSREVMEQCRAAGREAVLIDYARAEDAQNFPTVLATNREGMLSVMQHLYSLGHTRIGYISGGEESVSGRERLAAYREALQAAGIDYDPGLVGDGRWMQQPSYLVAKALLQQPNPPTAIAASNDASALGVVQAARELGLEIGRQLSITGFDNIRLASLMTPPLTTVNQQIYQLGQIAVEMLDTLLKGNPLPERHVRLATELIVRQSTGTAPTR